jgi:hypothetical protein
VTTGFGAPAQASGREGGSRGANYVAGWIARDME